MVEAQDIESVTQADLLRMNAVTENMKAALILVDLWSAVE
jgi:hypothetical protein